MSTVRNPLGEAQALLADGYIARVLEPSPPAVDDGEFFADDPTSLDAVDGDVIVVSPTTAGEILWDELAADDPDIAAFSAERWLGAYKELLPLPEAFEHTRLAAHRLAYSVVAQARFVTNGKFGLRYTKDGFGTPFFGADEQVRVEGLSIVRQRGDEVASQTVTTIEAAARLVEVEPGTEAAEHDSPELGALDENLSFDEESMLALADWFGFATSALEEFRLTPGARDVTRVQLWPGHFDVAMEMGKADAGQRATYGASPGDADHDEPYVYVGAWGEVDTSNSFWNANTFGGAMIAYGDLLEEPDPREAAIDFYRTANQLLRK